MWKIEPDSIVLTTDLPKHGLKQGDIGTVVLVHRGGKGYEVEFMTLDGETLAVVTLLPAQVRPIVVMEKLLTRGQWGACHVKRLACVDTSPLT
jgi:uncharacterized protein DUF4926